ncbi:uncharacterized protein PHALS_10520 [Plasmopara halstedii]|uniref:Uncharacterized protein n=1 Tax=Plasmopara halstedii TaxID=4781 RepID=A0A0P1AGK1_PLAHL|nr:uncharacterized protein PHALS_10520 [Plasmopara halstedii]CEG40312.1 hypothetical protein PHALS_10520 [Plasmopara halstedii]|eukprot:XP_024576681.1 hypothetical protein PHALS_10520 [Plasmopara halstedii]
MTIQVGSNAYSKTDGAFFTVEYTLWLPWMIHSMMLTQPLKPIDVVWCGAVVLNFA